MKNAQVSTSASDKPKGKYPSLEAALKVKNDAAREHIKRVKLPESWGRSSGEK